VSAAPRGALHSRLVVVESPSMNRLPSVALLLLIAAPMSAALAAEASQECAPAVLATLARELKVAHFAVGQENFGKDPAGVLIASSCKRMPDDPRLTLAAVSWDAHEADNKALAIAIVDESTATVAALLKDDIHEDAATQVNAGSLRLDTAPYELAPGVRAFGLDIVSEDRSCGEGGMGPSRTLYVREGRTLRPVLEGLTVRQWWYLRGNQPRCATPKAAASAILEDYTVSIGLGAPGRSGRRDLVLTVISKRSDHKPGRQPLHVSVPYDGHAYDLKAFTKTYDDWRK
jgi:hypothetical protein